MIKKTVLNDDASIYQHQDKRTEREKLKDMTGKEKVSYVFEYYKLHISAILICLVVITYIIYSILNPDPIPALYVAAVNLYIDENSKSEYAEKIGEYLNIDFDKEEVVIDTSMYFNADGNDTMSLNNRQKLTTYMYAGQIDILMTDSDVFSEYSYFGYFCDLSENLPEDLYSKLSDKIVFNEVEDSDKKYAFGIQFTPKGHTESSVIGIAVSATNKENAIKFIQFLYDNNNIN